MNIRVNQAKFLPPTLRDDQVVSRARLLKQAAHRAVGKRFVFVEGQPGQGKTTFTHQFVKHLKKPFFWYRLEAEDNDPLYLASGLLHSLNAIYRNCDFSLTEEVLAGGGADCFETVRILGLLFAPTKKGDAQPGTIVFDDLHLLDSKGLGHPLLRGFLSMLPDSVQTCCISRTKIFQEDEQLRKSAALIDNAFLSFKNDETGKLFSDVFELTLPGAVIEEAVAKTGGWSMGLVMAGNELSQSGRTLDNLGELQSIEDYFSVTVRPKVSDRRWNHLLKLSLLDDFSLSLTQRVLGEAVSEGFIDKLHERNFFLRRLGAKGDRYEFHHLFLDFLRAHSAVELNPEEVRGVLSAAAGWCLENGEFEKALAYSIRHGDLDGTEKILKVIGLQLYAANRLITLNRVLCAIPPEEVGRRGILALFAGLSMVGIDPERATGRIELSAEIFRREGEPFWELIASSQALFCHMMITFNFLMGRPHLERLVLLEADFMSAMPPEGQSFVYNAMALGHHYITGNGELSYQYSIKAISMADRSGLPNVVATALCGSILCCMGTTRLADGRILLNRARAMVADQHISGFQRMTLRFLIAHFCAIGGDWVNWRFFRREAEECDEAYLLDKGIFRDFFDIEDIDYLILTGDTQAATESSVALLHRSQARQKKHIYSLALGQYALVLALKGRELESDEKIKESIEIRKSIGGDTFRAFQFLYAGAALATFGDVDGSRRYLDGVAEMTRWMLGEYSQAIVNLNLALALINAGRENEATPNIVEFLEALAKLPLRHLITLHPGSMAVIAQAIRLELKPPPRMDVVRELFGKSVTTEGEIIPAMKIKALGGLSIHWGETTLGIEELTAVQRLLVVTLLCAPGFMMEKEILAARLWADSQRDKAIANFDMTLSRLRKAIDDLLGMKLSRNYVTVKNGIVGFDHCDIDIANFESATERGFAMSDGHRSMEGNNKLRDAEHLWGGELLKGLELPDEGYHRREQLTSLYSRVAQKLASSYLSLNALNAAEMTVRKALLTLQADAELNKTLHRTLMALGNMSGAKTAAESYAAALRKAEFSPAEIKKLTEELWNI